METQIKSKEPPIYLMFLLICIGTIGGVLYTPALPYLTEFFHISDEMAQHTMSVYLLGYALGQLIYGPVSNKLGRKPALYIGLSIAAFGAFLSSLSAWVNSFPLLLLSRLIYPLGASCGLQVIFTVIGDFYKPPRSSQIASYLTLAFAIGPSIGITIGGFLTQYINWQSCFYFLFIYCLFLIYLVRFLPETCAEKDPYATKPKNIAAEYFLKIKDPKIILSSLIIGAAVAFSYIFATIAPFIAIDILKIDPSKYGMWNLMPAFGLILGSLFSAYFSSKFSSIKLVLYACITTAIGAFAMLFLFSFKAVSLLSLFIPFTVALFGQPIIEANVLCLSLHHNKNKATTSAIINCLNLAISIPFVVLVSLPKTIVPVILPILLAALSIFMFYFYKRLKLYYGHKESSL